MLKKLAGDENTGGGKLVKETWLPGVFGTHEFFLYLQGRLLTGEYMGKSITNTINST